MDELISLVSDENKETFKEKFAEYTKQLDSKIEALEAKLLDSEENKKDIVSKRDKLKNDMKELLEKLQVPDDLIDKDSNEIYENIKKNLTNNNEKTDIGKELSKNADILRVLKETHNKEIDTLRKEWQDERTKNQEKLENILFEKEANSLCDKFAVKPAFRKAFIKQIKDENKISLENDRFVFKNDDGTTIRKAGDELTLQSYIDDFHKNEDNAEWFQSLQQQSGVPDKQLVHENNPGLPERKGMLAYLADNPW